MFSFITFSLSITSFTILESANSLVANYTRALARVSCKCFPNFCWTFCKLLFANFTCTNDPFTSQFNKLKASFKASTAYKCSSCLCLYAACSSSLWSCNLLSLALLSYTLYSPFSMSCCKFFLIGYKLFSKSSVAEETSDKEESISPCK